MVICLKCCQSIELVDKYWQCDCTLVKACDGEPNAYILEHEPDYWKTIVELVNFYKDKNVHHNPNRQR